MHDITEKCPVAVASGERGRILKAAPQSSFAPPRMQGTNTWHESKPVGDAAERRLAEHFRNQGYHVLLTVGEEDHDLEIVRRLEVKHDLAAQRTGRVAVETEYRERPSGLSTTRADAWAFIIADEALIVGVADLRAAVASGRFPEKAAGDSGRARCVLIPRQELRRMPGVRVIRLQPAMSRAV